MDLEVAFTPGIPLHRQLEDTLRSAIRSGRLVAGSALPPSRDLADQLGISRGVVVRSYSQLTAEGYLTAKRGAATRVALVTAGTIPHRRQVEPAELFRYELRPGTPDFRQFPRARWKTAMLRALHTLPHMELSYGSHCGIAGLRNAVAGYLARVRGVVVESDRVVVCCAASHALTVLWQVLRARGARTIAVEDPGWRWQRYTAEQAGLTVVPVRVDADGMVISELAAAGVDAVVITPAHHYPTGVIMTAPRRAALIAWARQRGAIIIEDDYDAEFRFGRDPVSSLQGMAPDLVAFVGTTSKTLAPALRLAWMIPPAQLMDDVESVMLATGVTPPTVDQLAMAMFIEDGALDRHLRSMRRHYGTKRATLVQALGTHLPTARVSGTAAGLHLLAWLPGGADERGTAVRARQAGVALHELHRHCTSCAPSPPALLLGFAYPTESDLVAATKLIADALC
jgi:GntR family transcriptional regulator/MocR family aminotransferase